MKLNVSLAMPSALLSMSVGVGSLPVAVSLASSVTAATAAATAGASLVPLMITVRTLEAVPPCPSLTV